MKGFYKRFSPPQVGITLMTAQRLQNTPEVGAGSFILLLQQTQVSRQVCTIISNSFGMGRSQNAEYGVCCSSLIHPASAFPPKNGRWHVMWP